MPGWNFADIWEVVAQQLPDAQAQVQGDRRYTWAEFDRRANGVAQALLDAGVEEQDKVAQYLYNGPEYLESMFATFKAGLAPINTNYRYLDDELLYLWDNGDVVAVVFHGTFAERIENIRDRLPLVKLWLWVDDGAGPVPRRGPRPTSRGRGGTPCRSAAPGDATATTCSSCTPAAPPACRRASCGARTTSSAPSSSSLVPGVRDSDPDEDHSLIREAVTAPGMVGLPACPLMHGTGCFTQLIVLSAGGSTRHPRGPQPRHRGAAQHHRARARQHHRHRGRRLRPPDDQGPRRRRPASTTSPASS